jgi:predicted secreted hydrolase
MKISALLVCATLLAAADYRPALPGYRFEFPRDHFNHPEFRTEWWYYTGNLRDASGRRFGYELTFFRHAVQPELPKDANVWDVRDVWMAHFALSDIDGGQFLNTERLNRSGRGLAGVDAQKARIWNGNWSVQWLGDVQELKAVAERFRVEISMRSAKPPVVHGVNGVSQKAAGAGRASHYVSLTRLITKGAITLDGKRYQVEGLSWMDHEFFSNSMAPDQAGWDWFSLQFNDGSELMLYRLRRKDGSIEPYSSGTYIDAAGKTKKLRLEDFKLEPGRKWTMYPIEWKIRVPSLSLDLAVSTRLPQQELKGMNTYWEGAVEVTGSRTGSGYLEMTGYAAPVRMGN